MPAMLSWLPRRQSSGVVGVSTGNHNGLAHAAREKGVRCIICMSQLVPQNKIDGIKAPGAEVRIVGRSQDDAQIEVDHLVTAQGMTMIPLLTTLILLGQASLGLEPFEALPELQNVLVPVSGGGLISGVASATLKREIIAVSMERGAAMHACLQAGKPILVKEKPRWRILWGAALALIKSPSISPKTL